MKLYSSGVLEQSVDYLNDALYYRKPIPINILHSNPFETYINHIHNSAPWQWLHIISIICYISILIFNNSIYINNNMVYRISSVVITCTCYCILILELFMKWRLGKVNHPAINAVNTNNSNRRSDHTNSKINTNSTPNNNSNTNSITNTNSDITNSNNKYIFLSALDFIMGLLCFIELLYHASSVYGLKMECLGRNCDSNHHIDHYDRIYRGDIWWGLAVCRVYFLATASETTQQSFICLFKGIYSAFGMVFMQLSVIFIFSVVAVVLYGGGIEKHNLSNLYVASKSMFILSTTSSNPDLWLPLYAQNSVNGLYFIGFLVISVLITNNIVAVSVYNGFVREMLHYMTRRRRRRLDSLLYSFQCLDIHNRHNLDGELICALLKHLRPHYNESKIQYLYEQIDSSNSGTITQAAYCNTILHVLNLSVRSVYMGSQEAVHHIWVHNHSVDDDLPSIYDILLMCWVWVEVEAWCVVCMNGWNSVVNMCRDQCSRIGSYISTNTNTSSTNTTNNTNNSYNHYCNYNHGHNYSLNSINSDISETTPLVEIEMCTIPTPSPSPSHSQGQGQDARTGNYSNNNNGNSNNNNANVNSDIHSYQQDPSIRSRIEIEIEVVCICLINLLYVSYVCVNAHTFLTIIDNSHKELFLHIATTTSLLSCCSVLLFIFQTCVWYPWVKQHPNTHNTHSIHSVDSTSLEVSVRYIVDCYHWLQYIFRNKWDVLSMCASTITLVRI